MKEPPKDARQLQQLGIDLSTFPTAAKHRLDELVGAYAHVLGCVENDVNSQLTKVCACVPIGLLPTRGAAILHAFPVR